MAGPMLAKVISRQSDLTPRPGGIPFRKLAGRSDACGEALIHSVRVRASTPAHDRPALHLNGQPQLGGSTAAGLRQQAGGVAGASDWARHGLWSERSAHPARCEAEAEDGWERAE
jgi:hypothetical protein